MASELGQAFYTVYTSSKEILKNHNQRHLFCNTLDLLTSTCKTTGMNCNLISNNDLVKFWLGTVMPLLFDEDRAIQSSAVAAVEQALVGLDVSDIHTSCHWAELKNVIVTNYSASINELRDAKNPHWQKIWCMLIRVLDKDILRGASVINSFLSVVELGFRNSDSAIRAEAFVCWRLLIKIFSAYNELSSPKRLKLICIPLKSSQSKSTYAATVKFRTWWFLITCLGENIAPNFNSIVEPFLFFTFGVGGKGNVPGIAQQYRPAFALALPCLVTLLTQLPNEPLQRIMTEHQLEPFTISSPLMERDAFKQHWPLLLSSAIESLKVLNKHDTAGETTETEQQLQHMLLRSLTQTMMNKKISPFIAQFCAELEKLISDQPRPVLTVFNTIATENLTLQRDLDDIEQYKSALVAFMSLCIKAKSELPPSILQRGIINVFATEALQVQTQMCFRQMKSFFELILHNSDDENYNAFEVKLMIWRQLSQVIIDYLRTNSLEYRLKSNAELLDRWILWPLQTCAGFAGRRSSSVFDSTFCDLWRQLLNAGHNSLERKHFLANVKAALHELANSRKEESNLGELFDAYVAMVLKFGISKDCLFQSDVFELFNELLTHHTLPQKTVEGCLNTLRNAIIGLKNSELTIIFEALRPLLSLALETWSKQKYEGAFLDEWKRSIQDKFRSHPTKTYASQIKDLFKGNDVFVIIPTVWSLNPEKLTDRQKERFAEKADIPALYNDMSQSQDASIKPWTPKKIVIAKNNQAEIAIETEHVVIDETPEDNIILVDTQTQEKSGELVENAEQTPPNPKKSVKSPGKESDSKMKTGSAAQSNEITESASAEKYNFRKTRSSNDEEARKILARKLSIDEHFSMRMTRLRNAKKDANDKLEMDKPSTSNMNKPPSNQRNNSPKPQMKKSFDKDVCVEPEPPAKTVSSSEEILTSTELGTPCDNIPNAQRIEPSIEATVAETIDLSPPVEDNAVTVQLPAIEAVLPQESSPRKPTTRFSGLSSPPDRKLTNNSSSPTLRPKPTSHLTGRGAQLINMIRNKKSDAQITNPLSSSLNKSQGTPARFVERYETATPTIEIMDLTTAEQTSTPIVVNDFLTFTKRLPSPTASPSVSILKRKMRSDSIDESIDSPAFKRKRVSFHDPPVSITKEYMRDTDESKAKPKRCLQLDKVTHTSTPDNKQSFKRRSRIDSIIEIERFGSDLMKAQTEANTLANKSIEPNNESATGTDSPCRLRWNDSCNNTPNVSTQSKSNNTTDGVTGDAVNSASSSASSMTTEPASAIDVEMALSIVAGKCTLETVLEKYCSKQNPVLLKNTNTLAKFISNQMSTNPKIKTNVLETLSENHSKDFLDHAVQENLSSVVCDRLNLNSILEYICSKSKINTNCRNTLLSEVPGILRSSKVDAERLNFVENLLQKSNFSDDNILDIIAILMRMRERREFNIESVSESAVDSSSNL